MKVLSFNGSGQPWFDEAHFSFRDNGIPSSNRFRFQLHYKKHASVVLRFDPELNMIILDELLPEDDDPEKSTLHASPFET